MSEKINEKRGIEKSSKPVPPKAVYCPAYSLSQATCAAIRPPAPPPPFPSPRPPFATISPCPEKSTVLIRILPPLPPPLLDVPLAPSLSMMPSKCREYPTVIWEKENQTARVKAFFGFIIMPDPQQWRANSPPSCLSRILNETVTFINKFYNYVKM